MINIEWKNFFRPNGLVNPDVVSKLIELGVAQDSNIIVISNQGVRSGAVAYALQELGFKKAANFSGGYNNLQ